MLWNLHPQEGVTIRKESRYCGKSECHASRNGATLSYVLQDLNLINIDT